MIKKLSERQESILTYIKDFLDEHSYPPTVRDIQTGCNISSTSVVDYNLRILQRDGYLKRETEVFAEYPTLLAAHVTKTPIKQRLLIFSRTSLKEPKIDELKKIIKDVKAKSNQYNYDWIGIMSGSGFTHEVLDYAKTFHEQGIGLGLIDAVTKQLIVNKETDEGAHLNQMFLSECIS